MTVYDYSITGSTPAIVILEKNSIVYTDYKNILVLFSCYQTKVDGFIFPNRKYLIAVRDESYDCSLCNQGLTLLDQLGLDLDSSNISYTYNGPNCPNF